jgi:hypothetical protein
MIIYIYIHTYVYTCIYPLDLYISVGPLESLPGGSNRQIHANATTPRAILIVDFANPFLASKHDYSSALRQPAGSRLSADAWRLAAEREFDEFQRRWKQRAPAEPQPPKSEL